MRVITTVQIGLTATALLGCGCNRGNGASSTVAAQAGTHNLESGVPASAQAPAPSSTPSVPGACKNLAEVGVWEDITPVGVSGALKLITDAATSSTVYLGTGQGFGVYRSKDCGSTWAEVSTGQFSEVMRSGYNWLLIQNPVDPQVLYSQALYGSNLTLLKSVNSGTDWHSVMPAGDNISAATPASSVQWASMDPNDPNHLVAIFHENCVGEYAPACMAETKDGGESWRIFKGPIDQWVEGASIITLGPDSWIYTTLFHGLYSTTDGGKNWSKIPGNGAGSQSYLADDRTLYLSGSEGIRMSQDHSTWSLIEGSPACDGLIGDGEHLYAGTRYPPPGYELFVSEHARGGNWKPMSVPKDFGGAVFLSFDRERGILYSANGHQGRLWRIKVR